MRPVPQTLTLLAAFAVAATLTACTPQSHRVDAERLANEARALVGVADVDLTYEEPITFDSADVRLDVLMADDAPDDAVIEVVRVAYSGFSTDHEHEEADLDVWMHQSSLHVRAFESPASVEDVTEAAARVLEILRSRPGFSASLDTQWPPKGKALRISVCVPTARNATRTEKRQARRDLSEQYGEGIRWFTQPTCRTQR